MKVQPVVEGHGEVSAVPVLLRRMKEEAQAYGIEVNPPIRRKRSELVLEDRFRLSIRLARQQACRAIIVILDSDDDCPGELGPRLQAWATDEATPLPCVVVLAHREYEAWFLASIESLRGLRGIRPDATSHPEPERPRDAKGQLEVRMQRNASYHETTDQAALSARIEFSTVYRRCRSFRKLVHAFESLLRDMGQPLSDWPPATWLE